MSTKFSKSFLEKLQHIFDIKYKYLYKQELLKHNKKILIWKIYRFHWEKNRFFFDIIFNNKLFNSKQTLIYDKTIDLLLMKYWKKAGFEIICSPIVINNLDHHDQLNSSTCRVPLLLRNKLSSLRPDIRTGCITCVSGEGIKGKPVWWNTKIS